MSHCHGPIYFPAGLAMGTTFLLGVDHLLGHFRCWCGSSSSPRSPDGSAKFAMNEISPEILVCRQRWPEEMTRGVS